MVGGLYLMHDGRDAIGPVALVGIVVYQFLTGIEILVELCLGTALLSLQTADLIAVGIILCTQGSGFLHAGTADLRQQVVVLLLKCTDLFLQPRHLTAPCRDTLVEFRGVGTAGKGGLHGIALGVLVKGMALVAVLLPGEVTLTQIGMVMALHCEADGRATAHTHLVSSLVVVLAVLADTIDTALLIVVQFRELRIKPRLHGILIVILAVKDLLIDFLIDIPRLIDINIMGIGEGRRTARILLVDTRRAHIVIELIVILVIMAVQLLTTRTAPAGIALRVTQ